MVETLQRTSSLPLPEFQTEKSTHDPLPLNAPREQARVDETAKRADGEEAQDRFEDYLNQTGIMVLKKAQESTNFDPATEIASESVYGQPNGKTPF